MPVEVHSAQRSPERPVLQAVLRGMRLRCPNCGRGHVFRAYLKVADRCDHCGEELMHHRADDLPPYIAIFIVGHVLIGLMLDLEMTNPLSPGMYLAIMVPLALIMPLAILPSIKGAVVGLQWANRMHGFGRGSRDPALPDRY
jgi:uncharacterized protein (DUF983 family)